MNQVYLFLAICLISEVALTFLFWIITRLLTKRVGFDFRSLLKGLLERFFLFVSLTNGYAHALTFFSAIKLATRLKHDDTGRDQDRFNDYYLIGNMISVLAAIGYVQLWKTLFP